MNLTFNLILFGVLAMALVAMYMYRRYLENHEDHYIHLHNDSHDDSIVNSQTAIGKRMEMVDKVKTGLIAAVIVYGVAIAAMAIYQGWMASGKLS
jgi:hypothetical protein